MFVELFGLARISVLTWLPAGDVPVTCLRGGYSPSQWDGQNTPGHWDCLRVNCGHVFGNTVRYIYTYLFYLFIHLSIAMGKKNFKVKVQK